MILYITYNDQPSGVYWSQVTDAVAHMNSLGGPEVRLVAFVSARGFGEVRRSIRERSPAAWVMPMVPTMRFWKWNVVLLALACLVLRPTGVVARGVFATWMASRMRGMKLVRKVCFDARGAYAAEWEEYRLVDDDALIAQVRPLEHAAVHGADIRLAVSTALVEHWAERYAWSGGRFVVIPCTLGRDHAMPAPNTHARSAPAHGANDVVVVYSGSTAGWQSFAMLKDLLIPLLEKQPQVKVLFLSRPDANNRLLQERFPDRVQVKWADPAEVAALLGRCDHGLLLREETVTNQVASPTKFAEYLASGLQVIISGRIGDFSGMVREHGLGLVVEREGTLPRLARTDSATAARMQAFAERHLTKSAFNKEYRQLLKALG